MVRSGCSSLIGERFEEFQAFLDLRNFELGKRGLGKRRQSPFLILALNFDISGLATLTSQLILAVFVIVNLALVHVKWRERKGSIEPVGTHIFQVPIMVPVLGAVLSLCLLVFGH